MAKDAPTPETPETTETPAEKTKKPLLGVPGTKFLLDALPSFLGFFNQTNAVNRRNRERLKQHARNEAKYINDFNRDIVLWKSKSTDREIAVDDKWQDVLGKIAREDLALWSGISQAGIATQQAYATMMSVGTSEQTGARSATTTNRRKAVLQYAAKMQNVANKVALTRDNAALNRSTWGNEFTRFAQASQVKTIEGRPMPGTPPPSIPLENKPDLLTGLILPLAGHFIDYKDTKKKLDPPYSDDEMRPDGPGETETETETETQPDWGEPGNKEVIGDFFTKRNRNIASSRLGSSFYTTAT